MRKHFFHFNSVRLAFREGSPLGCSGSRSFRENIFPIVLLCILVLITLSSSEWFRLKLIQHELGKKDYIAAEEASAGLLRKRRVSESLNRPSANRILASWNRSIEGMIDDIQKDWINSRSFFIVRQRILDEIAPRIDRIQSILDTDLLDELNGFRRWNRLLSSVAPYPAQRAFLENDINLESGFLSFGYSGGVALDYNLRSIGANLGSRKPIVGICLRRWAEQTRVKPENLCLWTADDNRVYSRYIGQITFSNKPRAMFLDHLDIRCQYLKVHCDFKDDKFTYAEDLKSLIEVHGPPDFS